MVKINLKIREDVVLGLKNRFSQSAVSRECKITRSAEQCIWNKFITYSHVNDLPCFGWPCLFDERKNRKLIRLSKKNPMATAAELQNDWETPKMSSISTVKRILRRYGFLDVSLQRKPLLTKKHVLRRKTWCSAYIKLDATVWNEIIFSDECRLELHLSKRQYFRRPCNNRYLERYTAKNSETWSQVTNGMGSH